MLPFKPEEYVRLADSRSAWPDNYGDVTPWDGDPKGWTVVPQVIQPLLDRIERLPNVGLMDQYDELATYATALVYDKRSNPRISEDSEEIEYSYTGMCLYLSLFSPYCALGSCIHLVWDVKASEGTLGPYRACCPIGMSLSDVIDSIEDIDELFRPVVQTINESRYQLLMRGELEQPLPPSIHPEGESAGLSSDGTHFHLLFQKREEWM